jgi:tetratricopeptide (TPR) repeat protein
MLGAADPSWYNSVKGNGASVTLLEVVDQMRDHIGSYFGDDPQVEIRLRRTIGRMYAVLSRHAEARTQLGLAVQKQLPLVRADDPSLGLLYVDLAGVEYRSQQETEAERDAGSAVRILEKARRRQDRDALMSAYNYLGIARLQNGAPFAEQMEPLLRSLEIGKELYGNEGPTLTNLSVLATTNLKAGHFDQAEKYLAEAIAIADARPGPKRYEYYALLRDRARLCFERKNLECAAQGYQAALDFIRPFEHGNDSIFTINVREWLALTNGLRGNYAAADREFQAIGAKISAIGGSTTESYLAGLDEFHAQVNMAAGKFDLAEHGFRSSLQFFREHRKDQVQNAVLASRLGEALARGGKSTEAGPLLRDSYQTIAKAMGPNHMWATDARARVEILQ